MEKNVEMDMTPLDKGQMNAMRRIVLISQEFADRVERIMKQYGMWEKYFAFQIRINPDFNCFVKVVELERTVIDGIGEYKERIKTYCGQSESNEGWKLEASDTSREFIHLLDAKADGDGTEEVPFAEKPFPSDNLWVGAADNDSDVDPREWDVNDSLS